jgi:hypothetical protein
LTDAVSIFSSNILVFAHTNLDAFIYACNTHISCHFVNLFFTERRPFQPWQFVAKSQFLHLRCAQDKTALLAIFFYDFGDGSLKPFTRDAQEFGLKSVIQMPAPIRNQE